LNEARLLRFLGLRLSPDLVVICFFLNDAGGGGTSAIFNDREGRTAWWRGSRLLDQLVFRLRRPRRVRKLVDDYRRSFAPDAPGWLEAQAGLREAVSLSRKHGFDLVLMIFPVLWELSADYPFSDIHQTGAGLQADRHARPGRRHRELAEGRYVPRLPGRWERQARGALGGEQ
jgi:hypothetical protein